MSRCPECGNWTLEFDEYFGRYRCFHPSCGWMQISSVERQLHLLSSHESPTILVEERVPELDLNMTVMYDHINDVLSFNFSGEEFTYDLPEPNGSFVWKIGQSTRIVQGFDILNARRNAIAAIQVDIVTRKHNIEENLREIPSAFVSGRPSRSLIKKVSVIAKNLTHEPLGEFKKAVEKFKEKYVVCG